ncbi:NUDIX domain-containing protein [Candidatus Daviesbacteria bacterium]|nr:NUDIX domain-containing protein [Candidatus Daviesbacteria bacterium]
MNSQIILEVRDGGEFVGYIPKEEGHTGEGRRHLAIAVLIYNSKGQVLLQRRKHKIFDNIWDITGATHPLHKEDGTDETLEEATRRCLEGEWDIRDIKDIKILGNFNYFAKYENMCENEHCYLLIGEYNGDIDLNSGMGYEYKWTDKFKFLEDIKSQTQNFTPWAIKSVEILEKASFFTNR